MTGKPFQDDLRCSFTIVEVLSGSRPLAQPIEFISKASQLRKSKGKMLKERKKKIIICFPHADACMQFQIPDVKVMFHLLWMCMEREGGDMERRFGWLLLDCDCCAGQEALRTQHRKRETSLIFIEWTEISCKAEMLCLGQARAALWSANKLGFCAAVLHYWHPCTAVWKHLLPHLLYKPFGNKLKEVEIHREEYHGALDLEGFCRFLWIYMSFGGGFERTTSSSFSLWY